MVPTPLVAESEEVCGSASVMDMNCTALSALREAALRSECNASWDMAIRSAKDHGHSAALESIVTAGLVPGDCSAGLPHHSQLPLERVGSEAWVEHLVHIVGLHDLQDFFYSMAVQKQTLELGTATLMYGSDCSGLDSPALALKSLVAKMNHGHKKEDCGAANGM